MTKSGATYSLLYDTLNNLRSYKSGSASLADFTYDGDGMRVTKTAGGKTVVYHYDKEGRIISETDGAGTLISDYIYLNGKLVAKKAPSAVYFYHTDPAGTPMAMTNMSRSVVWRAEYKPFGEEQSISGSIENNEKFTGKEKDKETGLYYLGARYMRPEIGRFAVIDPIGPVDPKTSKVNEKILSNPQRLNLYAYAGNNPWKYIDPLGLTWEYSQTSGQLTHVDDQTEARTSVATGYSGHGPGLNNPDMQDVRNVGSIPQGTYDIAEAYRHKRLGSTTMNLEPRLETDTFDRNLFRIHGDNSSSDQSASHGCIVLPRDARDQINNSGDNKLRVIE